MSELSPVFDYYPPMPGNLAERQKALNAARFWFLRTVELTFIEPGPASISKLRIGKAIYCAEFSSVEHTLAIQPDLRAVNKYKKMNNLFNKEERLRVDSFNKTIGVPACIEAFDALSQNPEETLVGYNDEDWMNLATEFTFKFSRFVDADIGQLLVNAGVISGELGDDSNF